MSVLIAGTVALDTITTPRGKCSNVLGGSATYAAISAGNFSPVNLLAVVGKDFPPQYLNFLRQRGVNLQGLSVAEGKTFTWEGEYGKSFGDPRTISTGLGVLADFNPQLPPEYQNSEYLFLANLDPEIQTRILSQMARPKLVVSDTMNYWIENKRRALLNLLQKIDVFLLNELEARLLTGEANFVKAAKAVLKLGPAKIIVKKGEHGAVLFSPDSCFCVPAFLLDSIFDPTGAGDSFAGGFIGYLAKSKAINQLHLRKAIVYGSVMAAFAVEDFSLRRLECISESDVQNRFKEFKQLTEF